jgi:thioredoxin-related protein
MYKIALLTALLYPFTIAAVANAQMTETKVEWLRDIDEARMVAANSHRDVFVLFTGRSWCQPCEMLDQLLFHDAKFVSRLQELCVPVELDFNFGDTDVEKVREARFRNLAKRYLVLGYPTMVLMDSDGQPFFVAEYPVGNPAKFIARIERAIAKKNERDKHFALAQSADRINRLRHLHDGLLAVSDQLTSIEERLDDPLLAFYANEVVAIMTTSTSNGELSEIHAFYRKRSDARDEWLRNNRLWNTLAELRKSSRFEEGIELLTKELESDSSGDRWTRLEFMLIDFLVSADRNDEASSN